LGWVTRAACGGGGVAARSARHPGSGRAGGPARRRDGVRIPTLELSRFAVMTAEDAAARTVRPLGALGFGYCAPELAVRKPEVLHRLFEALGDRRLSEKTARIQARLSGEPAGQVLYWFLADALGYHQNREPMRAVAEALPLAVLEAALHAVRPEQRFAHAAGLLLGTAGFLPVSDRERGLVALSPAIWRAIEEAQGSRRFETGTSGTRWRIAAVRPANHPLRRLLSLAWLVADGQRGLLGEVRARFETVEPRRSLVDWLTGGPVPLGRDRAYEVLVNVVVPFAIALAEWTDEEPWREAAWRVWQRLPAGRGNRIVRSTLEQVCGPAGFRLRSARAEQGVLHLYRWGCLPRRCGECPVARLVHSGGAESG
ncbi:MAG: DUF2851 family protein, partial [Thermomicrobium sp.]|nr:DUF2851 family protein [Thermomicrobium sp.]